MVKIRLLLPAASLGLLMASSAPAYAFSWATLGGHPLQTGLTTSQIPGFIKSHQGAAASLGVTSACWQKLEVATVHGHTMRVGDAFDAMLSGGGEIDHDVVFADQSFAQNGAFSWQVSATCGSRVVILTIPMRCDNLAVSHRPAPPAPAAQTTPKSTPKVVPKPQPQRPVTVIVNVHQSQQQQQVVVNQVQPPVQTQSQAQSQTQTPAPQPTPTPQVQATSLAPSGAGTTALVGLSLLAVTLAGYFASRRRLLAALLHR